MFSNKVKDVDIVAYFFNKNDKKSILDPLTCLIRLAILNFKPTGTKISVYNSKISYNEPCIFQGPLRWTYGDKRGDLHNLYNPIKKSLIWYDRDKDEIKGIMSYSVKGIENLKRSYDPNSIITHSLDHYITLLSGSCEHKKEEEDNIIYKKIQDMWNDREISIIYNLLLELSEIKKNKGSREHINSLINSINSILELKESYVGELISESTTVLK